MKIGFHASHELYAPSQLLEFVRRAQRAGFNQAMCSDHFNPWTESQGQSGYTWSWLGAAMHATDMPFGMVCAPGQRYHPAIIAQAAATLGEMFPGRLWMSVGSGEYLNESITGQPWPDKPTRNQRLKECVDIMRRLWAGEIVNHDGLVRVKDARLYTRPAKPPAVFCAALSKATAEWCADWADGLITTAGSPQDLREKIDAFRQKAGDKPVFVQAALSYAASDQQALAAAKANWPICGLSVDQIEDLPTPQAMKNHCRAVSDDDYRKAFRISSSIQQHIDWIGADLQAGATRVYLHHIGSNMERFIDVFGDRVAKYYRGING